MATSPHNPRRRNSALLLTALLASLLMLDYHSGTLTGHAGGSRGGCGGGSSGPTTCSDISPCLEDYYCDKETHRCQPEPSPAALSDVTTITGFRQEHISETKNYDKVVSFPTAELAYERVTGHMTLECPASGCDPWDRFGKLVIAQPGSPPIQIARFVTPYNIETSGGPGSCDWAFDLTPYQSLLRGDVNLRLYIQTWAGKKKGYLISTRFTFHQGQPTRVPYKVVPLWESSHLLYGHPDHPPSDKLLTQSVEVDAHTTGAKVRVLVSGHGQGNTDNAAEFTKRWHKINAGSITDTWTPWRDDCAQNYCSPQGGSWKFNRAGWCPGDTITPHELDLTSTLNPETPLTIDYAIQPYTNHCRPDNPKCRATNRQHCMSFARECSYNHNGHTAPHWKMASYLILYKDVD